MHIHFMGPYAASKHALEALSDSLRREMMIYGVDVIVIQPGNVATAIWKKGRDIRKLYSHTDFDPVLKKINLTEIGKKALPVSMVSDKVLNALLVRKPKSRYVIPDNWLMFWMLPRILPDRTLDYLIDKYLNFDTCREELISQISRIKS